MGKRLRILVIEDSETDVQRLLGELVKGGYTSEHTRVTSGEQLREELARGPWDIVLSEYTLQNMNGIDALREVRARDDDIPFLMVSSRGGEDQVIESMRSGANDYLPKRDLTRLLPAVERELTEARIRRERKEAIRKLEERERVLRSALVDREILLREVHHRVKNNFQVIISLLAMQMLKVEDQSLRSVFQDSQNRIKAMALIHEHLYGTRGISEIDFTTYLRNLIVILRDSYCRADCLIEIAVTSEPIMLDLDQAIQCGLLLNEILTNAFKYAFPDDTIANPLIIVEVKRKDKDRILLRVADNGIGLDASLSPEHSDSVGLRIIHLLSKDLTDGSLQLDRSRGTDYTIVFTSRVQPPKRKNRHIGNLRTAG